MKLFNAVAEAQHTLSGDATVPLREAKRAKEMSKDSAHRLALTVGIEHLPAEYHKIVPPDAAGDGCLLAFLLCLSRCAHRLPQDAQRRGAGG